MPTHLRRYDEPGHIHFWTISTYRRLAFFWHDALKQAVIEGLALLQEKHGICLVAYVVMPEHVHVILFPHRRGEDEPVPISTLLHAFKRYVGQRGKEGLRDIWRREGKLWSEPLNAWAHGDFDKQSIWTPRGYDFNITNDKTLHQKIDYCHKNPVTRGLVSRPEDWRWSSFRFYELGDRSLMSMDWDGAWPIVW